uniref:12-oxophytodienoate reductase 1 n=1 Tax=Talaromyces marneffei PM1 TaxID=1077442 RepID=A0A093X6J0_TALMA
MPGVPGLFTQEQADGWRKVVDAVHEKGGYIYCQLWHAGRATIPQISGSHPVSASASVWDSPDECYSHIPVDEYGGSPEKRCRFVLELMDEVAKRIGEGSLAIRLSPFGLFNQARSEQRLETWTYLCKSLKHAHPALSYVSFVEPRYEQIFSYEEKGKFLASWGLPDVTLDGFREIFGDTPFFSAGGWNDANSWGVIESGKYDALLYGRYFISNPDLVTRLKDGIPLAAYDRTRFYGPFEDNTIGYTDYPVAKEITSADI